MSIGSTNGPDSDNLKLTEDANLISESVSDIPSNERFKIRKHCKCCDIDVCLIFIRFKISQFIIGSATSVIDFNCLMYSCFPSFTWAAIFKAPLISQMHQNSMEFKSANRLEFICSVAFNFIYRDEYISLYGVQYRICSFNSYGNFSFCLIEKITHELLYKWLFILNLNAFTRTCAAF